LWAYAVVAQDPRGVPTMGEHVRYNDKGVQLRWEGKEPAITANCVCENCNGRWMNEVEDGVKPILSAMIRDEQITLDLQAQSALASWLALKAIVERQSQSPIRPVQPEWIAYYREHQQPPDTWCIRIGRYVGNHCARLASGPVSILGRHSLVPFVIKRPGLLFSIAIGYFFGQVIGAGCRMPLPEMRELFSQIWPHPLLRLGQLQGAYNDLVTWPPKNWLTDADFVRYTYNLTGEPPPSL